MFDFCALGMVDIRIKLWHILTTYKEINEKINLSIYMELISGLSCIVIQEI